MRGVRPLNWLYDWLGLGSVGQNYEVLESVQPVVDVGPIEFPYTPKVFSYAFALIAGTTVNQIIDNRRLVLSQNKLPPRASLVLLMHISQDLVAAGDINALALQHDASSGAALTQIPWQSSQGALFPAGMVLPIIGGEFRVNLPAGTPTRLVGRKPLYVPFDGLLNLNLAASGVGTANVMVKWIDIPASAPVPTEFLT